MIKSTLSLSSSSLGWVVLDGTRILDVFNTKREARTFLRLARAAERLAVAGLKGTQGTGRVACDTRCTSAHGPLCSCSCMGQNHQADLAA